MSSEIAKLHQSKCSVKAAAMMKIYPDGSKKIFAASEPVFGESGWELSDSWGGDKKKRDKKDSPSASDLDRAKRRAAAKLRDYALCNDFKWFVTLTLDGNKIDRYDMKPVLSKLRTWLDNRVRRCGLKYVLVPELHKDGAIHFHGFFNDCGLDFVDSGTLKIDGEKAPKKPRTQRQREDWLASGAKTVYNLQDWQLGFSTAIQIYGDYNAAIGYVSKYVTKQNDKIGGRWYYSGGDLALPEIEYLPDISYRDLEALGAYTFALPGYAMAILEVKSSDP